MILQSLVEYYNRKAADPNSGIAPLGWEWKEISFLIELKGDGKFVALSDTRDGKQAKKFLVPILGESKGSGVKSNFPWENAEYIFGIPLKEDKQNNVLKRKQEFRNRLSEYKDQPWAHAILTFLDSVNVKEIEEKYPEAWALITKKGKGCNMLFAIDGMPVSSRDDFKKVYKRSSSVNSCACLVTGKQEATKEKEPSISGVNFFTVNPKKKNKAEVHIVSFNRAAFTSFRKKQGANAPIGETAAYAYTTALNRLLNSSQKVLVGDATVVFWSEINKDFETAAEGFLCEQDNPDAYTINVETFLKSPLTGVGSYYEDGTEFYVLGLSPNSARVAIRFWHIGTISEMAQKFHTYFEDLMICHSSWEKEHLSLQRLLASTALGGKHENILPNLAGNMMRSILEGTPFPKNLLPTVLQRIRADQAKKDKNTGKPVPCVSYPRAKLIKACLNRSLRFSNTNQERSLEMSLDLENTNVGYCLGRLFATLEKVQMAANPNINATIRDRFYGAASMRPATVFGTLMRLKNHHIAKLNDWQKVCYEKLLGEIMSKISDFPAHLSSADQGRFAIGYYHQMDNFYTSKKDKQMEQNT